MRNRLYIVADKVYKDYYFNIVTTSNEHYIHILKSDKLIGPCNCITTVSSIIIYYTKDNVEYCIDYKGRYICNINQDENVKELVKYYYTELVDKSFLSYRASTRSIGMTTNGSEYIETQLLGTSVISALIVEDNIYGIDVYVVELIMVGKYRTEEFMGGVYDKSNDTWLLKPSKQTIAFHHSNLSNKNDIENIEQRHEDGNLILTSRGCYKIDGKGHNSVKLIYGDKCVVYNSGDYNISLYVTSLLDQSKIYLYEDKQGKVRINDYTLELYDDKLIWFDREISEIAQIIYIENTDTIIISDKAYNWSKGDLKTGAITKVEIEILEGNVHNAVFTYDGNKYVSDTIISKSYGIEYAVKLEEYS